MRRSYEDILEKEGTLCTTNVGFSMMPLLRQKRDVIVIKPAGEYRKLDVVLFKREGRDGKNAYVLHRILKVLPEGRFWIVGDNCLGGEMVEERQILGVLTGLRRGAKEFDFSSFEYKLYLFFWIRPYKLRFLLLRLLNFARRCLSFVKRRVFHRGRC